jgi:MFS family permease
MRPVAETESLSLRTPIRSFAAIPGPIRLLTLGVFINQLGAYFAAFIALILASRGFGTREIASALVLVAVFRIAGSVVGGAAADRFGARRTIAVSTAAAAVVTACLSVAGGLAVVVALACCLSLLNAAYHPPAQGIVGSLAPPGQRVMLFAFYRLAVNVGASAGPAIAGFLATRSITLMLLIEAASLLCFAVVAMRLPRDAPAPREAAADRTPGGYVAVLRELRFLPFWLAIALTTLVYRQQVGVLPLAMRDHGFGPQVFGLLLSANALLVILLELPLSTVIRRWRPWVPIALGGGIVCAGFAINWFGISLPLLVAGVAAWTIGEILMAPMVSAVVAAIAAPALRSRYQATLTVAQSTGFSIGPAIGVGAYAVSPRLPWLLCAVIGVGVVVAFCFSLRRVPAQ